MTVPISTHLQISLILDQIVHLSPKTIIDVGCGLGIYGTLSRIYLEGDNLYDRENLSWNKKENWKTKIDCIEGFEKYITELHRVVYNDIFIGDAKNILTRFKDKTYDLVLAIDILEHFGKKDGSMFIKELQRIGKNVIIATPSEFIEQVVPENPFENHQSIWSREELLSFDFTILKDTPSLIGIYHTSEPQTTVSQFKNIIVRLYQDGDEYLIAKLFKEVFGREMPLDEWRWKYIIGRGNNKIYSAVAVSESHGIVAHYGCMTHRMIYHGKEVYGLAIGDVMVHPKFRGSKLFKKVTMLSPEESGKDGISIGYGFPNKRAMLLPEKLGLYEKVEDVFEATKEVIFANNIKRFIYKFFPLSFDDSRIDILWESVKKELRLAVIRDKEYLGWRYQMHPFLKYELWGLKKRGGNKLHGLAVLRQEDERMLIIDFVCRLDLLSILFQKIGNYAYTAGKKTIVLWSPEYLKDRLEKIGFLIKPSITCIPRSTHKAYLTKDKIKGNFFYTMGDTDFL